MRSGPGLLPRLGESTIRLSESIWLLRLDIDDCPTCQSVTFEVIWTMLPGTHNRLVIIGQPCAEHSKMLSATGSSLATWRP
jgi:hypothetical protein